MKQKIYSILLLVSFLLIVVHEAVPHHHHEENSCVMHVHVEKNHDACSSESASLHAEPCFHEFEVQLEQGCTEPGYSCVITDFEVLSQNSNYNLNIYLSAIIIALLTEYDTHSSVLKGYRNRDVSWHLEQQYCPESNPLRGPPANS